MVDLLESKKLNNKEVRKLTIVDIKCNVLRNWLKQAKLIKAYFYSTWYM